GMCAAIQREQLRAPQIPILSTVTGQWLGAREAQDSRYWAEQLVKPVEFGRAVRSLEGEPGGKLLWLEVGPGRQLWGALRSQVKGMVVAGSGGRKGEMGAMLEAAGRLWEQGVAVKRAQRRGTQQCRRVALPPCPLQRDRFWVEPQDPVGAGDRKFFQPTRSQAAKTKGQIHLRTYLKSSFTPPSTEQEKVIATLWSSVLGIREIGVHDDFFELGGDSLLAMQVLSRVRQNLGVELSVKLFLQARTIAEVVTALDGLQEQ